jgi:hypothetical protein
MATRRPTRGSINADARTPGSMPADVQTPHPDTPSRINLDPVTGIVRTQLPEISRVPENSEPHGTGTSSITVSEINSSTGFSFESATASAARPLKDYRIPESAKLPPADIKGDGLRKFKGFQYADIAGVGIVQVGKDPETGLYRATTSRELRPSGPVLIRDPVSKLWRLRTEAESASAASTDPRYAYQRAIEGEQPYTWDERTLINRLGAQARGLEEACADILAVSRVDVNAVRRMYGNHERIIPLLQDTVARFRIDREIGRFIDTIKSAHAPDYLQADLQFQFALLNDVWPGKAMALLDADGKLLKGLGPADATPVPLSRDQFIDGDLLKTLLSHLNEAETKTLLNIAPSELLSTPEANARRLRSQLAQRAEQRKAYLFDQRYRSADRATTPEAIVVQDKLEGLPGVVVRELVDIATPAELQEIRLGLLPRRLENLGRWALQDVRISRAYEGLYLESVDTTDTFRLALHSLENLGAWGHEVRLDIHLHRYGGKLLHTFGKADAATHLTFVEGENGTYQAYDDAGNAMHSASAPYNSLLHTLPDQARKWFNLEEGDTKSLKAILRTNALKPYQLREVLPNLPALQWTAFDPNFMRLRAGLPTSDGEVAQLRAIAVKYAELDQLSFDEAIPTFEKYNYRRGLKWLHERLPDQCFLLLQNALYKANGESYDANLMVIQSIEALPELQSLMLPEQFSSLTRRLFTDDALVPLTETERNLAANARNLRQTGRINEYESMQRAVRENGMAPSEALVELREVLPEKVIAQQAPVEVSASVMADLQMAQRAIYRAKELLPLSGNQLPSIWEKGGSAISKIKGLRELNLETGGFTAKMTIAEAARKAIEIMGGNCSENSKVTFSILANQPRTSKVHIVKATAFDHQFVVIGDDLSMPAQLVVADSWPEFPAAHLANNSHFGFELPPILTLEPGPAIADYAFINEALPGPAAMPEVSEGNTFRQIKMDKLYKSGYAQFVSLSWVGTTYYAEPGAVPVSFEKLSVHTVNKRFGAYNHYLDAFKEFQSSDQVTE